LAGMSTLIYKFGLKEPWRKGRSEGYIVGGGFVKSPSNVEVEKLFEKVCGGYKGEDKDLCIMGLMYGIAEKTEDLLGVLKAEWETRGYEKRFPFDEMLREIREFTLKEEKRKD